MNVRMPDNRQANVNFSVLHCLCMSTQKRYAIILHIRTPGGMCLSFHWPPVLYSNYIQFFYYTALCYDTY